jgi:hypothetical protein
MLRIECVKFYSYSGFYATGEPGIDVALCRPGGE